MRSGGKHVGMPGTTYFPRVVKDNKHYCIFVKVYNSGMLVHPAFNPVAFTLEIRWYGLMYLLGFLAFLILGKLRAKTAKTGITVAQVDDLLIYGLLGVILGGRVGYVLFYDYASLLVDPMQVFRIWEGGMSFHGGLLGVLAALYVYSRRHGVSFLRLLDFSAPLVPIGLAAGRLGNFINGELWGRATDVPWGMIFSHPLADDLPRHPSQLYQMATEGIVLFIIMWLFSAKPRPTGMVAGLFAILYSLARFITEFFREPDAHLGFIIWDWMTQGQLLSVPLFIIGISLVYHAQFRIRENATLS